MICGAIPFNKGEKMKINTNFYSATMEYLYKDANLVEFMNITGCKFDALPRQLQDVLILKTVNANLFDEFRTEYNNVMKYSISLSDDNSLSFDVYNPIRHEFKKYSLEDILDSLDFNKRLCYAKSLFYNWLKSSEYWDSYKLDNDDE